MAKKTTSFVEMLSGDKLLSKNSNNIKEETIRLTLNIPKSLKQRMLNHIANNMDTNLSDLTKDAIMKYLDVQDA